MLVKNLMVIGRCWHWYSRHKLGAYKLSGIDFPILGFLRDHHTINQDCLCTFLLLDKASMAKAAARLEDEGYIHREVNGENKREKLLALTERGNQLCEHINGVKAGWEKICLKGFSQEELEIFADLSERAAKNAVEYQKHKGVRVNG